jgi:legumain
MLSIINNFFSVKQLKQTILAMHDKGLYGELVFYLEACESGSMFEGILPSNLNVLAITASNATESSWGAFCDEPLFDTCLGDLFSINWLDDSDTKDLRKELIQEQFDVIKQKTNLSNAMKYGKLDIMKEIVGNFEGIQPLSTKPKQSKSMSNMPSRDIPLIMLENRLKKTHDPVKRKQLTEELNLMKMKRAFHDAHTR